MHPIYGLIENYNYKKIKKIIKHVDINMIDNNGNSLLYYAIFDLKIIKLLIKNGIDINIENKYKETALYYICFRNINFKTTKYLIKHGATITNSIVESVCYAAKETILKYILKKNSEYAKNNNRLLDKAIRNNHLNIIELLLQYNAKNHKCIYMDKISVIKLLIRYDTFHNYKIMHNYIKIENVDKLILQRNNEICNNMSFKEIQLNKIIMQYITKN